MDPPSAPPRPPKTLLPVFYVPLHLLQTLCPQNCVPVTLREDFLRLLESPCLQEHRAPSAWEHLALSPHPRAALNFQLIGEG